MERPTFQEVRKKKIWFFVQCKSNDISEYPALVNCLLGAVSFTKNTDIDRYKCSGYGTGFDRCGYYSHPSGENGKNVIIFGVDMSSSRKIDNKKYIF